MGKSNRGKSEEAMRQYGDPAFDASSRTARKAGGIYYGGPSTPTAAPRGGRDRSPSASGGAGANHQQIFQDMFPGGSLTSEQLGAKTEELAKHGIEVLKHPTTGETQKIKLPDGRIIDVIGGAGSTNLRQWLVEDRSGGAGGGGGGVAGQAIKNYGEILNRYREFADTGGYSPEGRDAIRSRALSPVRAVYSDVNRDIDRSRSLTGDYAPGYAATKAKVGREQAYATADATTNVEGMLQQMIQQGRLAGIGGMTSAYGTTPGQASMFGQQALQSQALQNQMGMGMMTARNQSLQQPGMFDTITSGASKVGGAILPFLSTREAKENIRPVRKSILTRLKKLPISTWNYKGDGRVHVGPMAEDFFEQFGGDRKTISPIDVAGVLLGSVKELAENAST